MKTKDIFFYVLGALIVIGFFVTLGMLIVKNDKPETISLAIGALLTAFGTVVGYFYGSSKGSADKTDMLNNKNNP